MKNARAIVGILFVFLLGAASGAFVTHAIDRTRMEAFVHGGPAMREEAIVQRLTARLDLDASQREQVKAIVHEVHAGIGQVRRQTRPRIEALIEQGQERINVVLRPEQREKFRKMIAERKAHRPPEGDDPGPGDHPRR
jgi:Spy/CpxP family protein refolding chaperone